MKLKYLFMICIGVTAILFNVLSSFAQTAKPVLDFTEEELKFIQDHPQIRLGVDPNFVPFEFIDSDGDYKGIAAEYIKLISERTGIEMIVQEGLTWNQAYELAVEKEIDVLPIVSKTQQREQFFLFSDSYYQFQRVAVLKSANARIRRLEDLYGIQVAVQRNSSHHSYLLEYPDISLSLYGSVEDALAAVANGSEIAFIGNLATSSYIIKSQGLTDLKYVRMDDSQSSTDESTLHFAVRNDWPELVSILNKSLNSITEEEKYLINNKWIVIENEVDYGPILRVVAIGGLFVLLILIVSIYWVVKLKKEVMKRIIIEEALLLAKQEAEMANQIKSSFLARMSHEIRTPLNAITGMSYLLKKTDINVTQRLYIDKVTQASQSMLGIINDILDFSKIEAGKVELERVSFNMDKILQQVVSIVAFKIEEQKIVFNLTKATELPVYFFGDSKRIEQILLNIINNACKFTSSGEVSLELKLLKQEVHIAEIQFIVKDSGIGMSQEQLDQLFTPFAQGDISINRRFGGTGLGLSIVKSLVDMMGGNIQVTSQLNKGSSFVITIPLEIDQTKEEEVRKMNENILFKDIHGVILDKKISNLSLIQTYMNAFGVKCEFMTSQEQAIHLLETKNGEGYQESSLIELLVLDFETPYEGGIEFVEYLRSNTNIKYQPKIIMMIPLMREDLLIQIEAMGIEMGITKPIIPSVLYNAILDIFKENTIESFDQERRQITQQRRETSQVFHILVVEDNTTNQYIARAILEQNNFTVAVCNHGQEGVDYFIEHKDKVDLILMDLHMPVMNGYDASRCIREINQQVPIVAMTADAVTGVEEACKAVGINSYISKPFDPDELILTLSQMLEKEEINSSIDTIDGLRRLGNQKEVYHMVLEAYLNENKDVELELVQAIESKNMSLAKQIIHKNKSGSGNIGAKGLYKVAVEFQKAIEEKDEKSIKHLSEQFVLELRKVLIEIETLLKLID